MKHKRLFYIPIGFLVLAIIASVVSFLQNDRLDQGYLHSDNNAVETAYGGTYFAVLGNIKDATHVTTQRNSSGLEIYLYDENAILLESYVYQIYPTGSTFDQYIVSWTPVTMAPIDDLDDYLFTVDLEEHQEYTISLTSINGYESDPINVVLITLDGNAYLIKQSMESVVYTSAILSVTSLIIVFVIIKVKDD